MNTYFAWLALCLFALPALSRGDSALAGKETNETAAANAAAVASELPAAVAAPPAPAREAQTTKRRAPIKVGPYTLITKKFEQKADTFTISGEIAGGRACGQLTLDFSLRNTVQPQNVVVRETIENYDPQTSRPFERSAAAQNDVRAWESWKLDYVTLQCINKGITTRHIAQPKQ